MTDHARGCEGRNYTCTCGYDDRRDASDDARDALIAELVEALRRSGEGWANALELGLIPERHRNTATILADEARAALAKWEASK